ncbi:MAG: leucine-rich repeat protein [Clostridia bacterium]|nr:leucine-rich repeat protein [Clostridia bacterium]
MKKTLLALAFVLLTMVMLCFVVSAETITVVDDGTTEITLGECIIEGLEKEIPKPTVGMTYELDNTTMEATITAIADETTTVTFVAPSTITYDGKIYKVTTINQLLKGTRNNFNEVLINIYIPDTVVTIGNKAFQYALCAEYVYIGSNVKTIGSYAFCQIGFRTYYSEGGCVKEFICKSKNIETIGDSAFFAREISKTAVLEFDLMNLKSVGANAFSTSGYITNSNHYYTGCPTIITSLDLTNGVVYASNSFTLGAGNQGTLTWKYIKIYADQLNTIRLDTAVESPATIHLIGGETPEEALTLPKVLFQAGLTYWTAKGGTRFIFDGYINAYDALDGVTSVPDKSPYVDYYFKNMSEFNHYIDSVKSTTEGANTLSRFAAYKYGYFVICNGNGTFTEYNCTYDSATGEFALVECSQENGTATEMTYNVVLDDDCTESTCCLVCDYVLVKGIEHTLKTTIKYENGYLSTGIRAAFCENDGCEYCKNSEETAPLFVNLGFSYGPDSVLQGFVVNRDALSDYTQINGNKSVKYGVIVGSVNRIGEKETLFDNELNVIDGAHNVSFDDKEFDMFVMKVTGLETDEYKSYELYLCAYVIEDGVVTYINNGTESKAISTISHNALTAVS